MDEELDRLIELIALKVIEKLVDHLTTPQKPTYHGEPG